MSILKDEYKNFLNDIENNIKNKEDLEYIKRRFADFVDKVLNQIDYIVEYKKQEIENLEDTQKKLENRIDQMQKVIDNIEKDIYSDEGFDFEIVCPYCNYEFMIDMDEERTEIQCPECKNMIELDWSGDPSDDEECNGHCSGCSGCDDLEDDENEDDEDDM